MKLAVAYCRVSTDLEEQQHSIQEQQKQWLQYFEQGKVKSAECGAICHRVKDTRKANGKGKLITELRADGLFIDEGISGTSLKNRGAFNKMIEDALLHKFDVIFIEDVTRFSRSTEDGLKIVKDLREKGVEIVFKKENLSSLDTAKEFELQLRLSLSQEESRMKSARMKWAFNRIHQNGGWNGTPPFGYIAKGGKLYVNEEQAKTVKLIFDMYSTQHIPPKKIADELNKKNIPTQKNSLWQPTMISKILDNRIYVGTIINHRQESDDITRKTRINIPESEQIIIQNEELRLISDEVFNLTQIERARRREEFFKGNIPKSEHLLSGLLFCDFCGGIFRRKRRHTKAESYAWFCAVHGRYGRETRGKYRTCEGGANSIKETDLEKTIKHEIKTLKKDNLELLFKEYLEIKFKDIPDLDIELLNNKNISLNNEMRLLRQDLSNSLISEDVYTEQLRLLNDEIATVKSDILRVERKEIEKKHYQLLFENYKKSIQTLDINNLTNADLKELFYKIFIRYRLVKGKKQVYLRFVYRFFDSTDDEIINDNGDRLNLWVPLLHSDKE